MNYSQEQMIDIASMYQYDNDDGSDLFFEPQDGVWTYHTAYPLCELINIMPGGADAWREWFVNETAIFLKEGLRDYRELLNKPVTDPVVLAVKDKQVAIWDGYHRIAASIINNRPLPAIVGQPPTPQ